LIKIESERFVRPIMTTSVRADFVLPGDVEGSFQLDGSGSGLPMSQRDQATTGLCVARLSGLAPRGSFNYVVNCCDGSKAGKGTDRRVKTVNSVGPSFSRRAAAGSGAQDVLTH
jgi:hypothetical protein